jgi:hypothetical protein
MGTVMNEMTRIAEEAGVAIVVLHHNTEGRGKPDREAFGIAERERPGFARTFVAGRRRARAVDGRCDRSMVMDDLDKKKLAIAIQHIGDLQARQTACEGVFTSLLVFLLAKEPAALSVLSAARGLTVQGSSAGSSG